MAKAPATVSKAKQAYATLTGGGAWSHDEASGIVANIEAESNFNEHAIGDGGTAYGICQWHSDRQLNFRKHFGHDIRSGTFDEQVQFITHEMTAGTEAHAGHVLKTAKNAHDAGVIVSRFYERPQDGDGHVSAGRGRRADDWSKLLP